MQKFLVLLILSLFLIVGTTSAQSKEQTTAKEKDKSEGSFGKEFTTSKASDDKGSSEKASKSECETEKKSKADTKSCCSDGKSKADAKKSDDHCKSENHTKAEAKSETYKAFNTVCPVSGMDVKASVKTASFNGKDYGFCCAGCSDKFSANPEKFSNQLNEDGTTFLKD